MTTSAACPQCGTAVAPGAKFCKTCGSALGLPASTTCPQCGTSAPPGAKFCKACGAALGSAPSRPPAYPPPAPYSGTPPAAARAGRLRWLIPVLALVGVVILGRIVLGGSAPVDPADLAQAVAAGNSFMSALSNGDFSLAYDLCTPAVQR